MTMMMMIRKKHEIVQKTRKNRFFPIGIYFFFVIECMSVVFHIMILFLEGIP